MSRSLDELPKARHNHRFSTVKQQKADGATYTPAILAGFVADQILENVVLPDRGPIRVLDPATGDGVLLEALLERMPEAVRRRLDVVAFDTDPHAALTAETRLLAKYPDLHLSVRRTSFLEHVRSASRRDLFSKAPGLPFDLVIANPPYVRTQVMGAQQAQDLAADFGLTGRVDLCFPFIVGISELLASNGVAGIIISNRFLTTKAGQAVRREVLSRFRVLHAWDLGDTKLFDAAVLPAVLLAGGRGTGTSAPSQTVFSSIYEVAGKDTATAKDPLAALKECDTSIVGVPDGRRFLVKHGILCNGGDPEGIWRVATQAADDWLATVEAHTWAPFRRIGKIRVGVKSTADKVFVRDDWEHLPGGEPELVRPLVTRRNAQRYKGKVPAHPKRILYPHEIGPSGRRPIELDKYPNAARYLESHKATLEARTYVIEAGRRWYEIWVPQDPAAWAAPKLVFPDIADEPMFWMEKGGGVVNGECYWLMGEDGTDPDWLWLALAVANSSFIEAFYDRRFNNKLYAGRRRFITQYVEKFPLPDPTLATSRAMVETVKAIYEATPSPKADQLVEELDQLVWKAFWLRRPEKISGQRDL